MIAEIKEALRNPELPDPIAVFLAGAFVGLSMGPQLVKLARRALETRSSRLTDVFVDYIKKGA